MYHVALTLNFNPDPDSTSNPNQVGIGDLKDEDGSRMQGEIPKSNNPKLDDLDDDIILPPPRRCPPPPPSPAPPPPPARRPPPPSRPSPPPDIIIHPCFEVRDVILASPDPNPGPDRPPHQTNTSPSPANAQSLAINVTANLRPHNTRTLNLTSGFENPTTTSSRRRPLAVA